jgi:hypothetical protein
MEGAAGPERRRSKNLNIHLENPERRRGEGSYDDVPSGVRLLNNVGEAGCRRQQGGGSADGGGVSD